MEGLMQAKKNLNQKSRYSGRDSNRAPPEYKSIAFPPGQRALVLLYVECKERRNCAYAKHKYGIFLGTIMA
jgi:hypothetical protein